MSISALLLVPKPQTCSVIGVLQHFECELKDWEKRNQPTKKRQADLKSRFSVLSVSLGQEIKSYTELSVVQQVRCIRARSRKLQFCKQCNVEVMLAKAVFLVPCGKGRGSGIRTVTGCPVLRGNRSTIAFLSRRVSLWPCAGGFP